MHRLSTVMKKNLTVLFLFTCATIGFSACAQTKDLHNRLTAYNRIDMATMNTQILQLINEHRKAIGKGNLQMIDAASTQATQHSKDMMQGTTPFGHDGFDDRVNAVRKSIGFVNAAAENVAYGQLTAAEVVDGWLHSPGHKKNIEGDYNLTGIGVAQNSDGVIYFTQIFFLKK